MQKLPSINLLVTFDAAARHLSFKHAADELFVTPAAVGHQIKVLEQALGTQLFTRSNRSIKLTAEGLAYHQEITQALQILKTATANLIKKDQDQRLIIHSIPYVTNALIVPHLKTFKAQHPGLKIGIVSKIKRVPLKSSPIEIAIRQGNDQQPDMHYEQISTVQISPVCSPEYLEQKQQNFTKLTNEQHTIWQRWEQDWGALLDFEDTLYCNGLQAVIEMAEQGLGVTMGYLPLLAPQLKAGKLILVHPDKLSTLDSIYLVYAKSLKDDPIVCDFIVWLKDIIANYV